MPCRCWVSIVRFINPTFPDRQGIWVLLKSLHCCRKTLATSLFERAVKRVVEDVAQRQQAYEVAALIDHNEAVHA